MNDTSGWYRTTSGRLIGRWCVGLCAATAALAMAGTAAARTSAPPPPRPAGHADKLLPVWALLDGRTPVSGARVRVYAGRPRELPEHPLTPVRGRDQRTNSHGAAMLEFTHLPRTFTVVVTGGRVLNRPLRGSMSAQLRGYRWDPPVHGARGGPVVHVNPVTTLIDAWRHVDPGVSAAHAQRVIDRALGIPAWADAIDLSENDQWLDGRIFLRHVRAQGTIDRETGDLVVKIRRGKHVTSFRAPASHRAHAAAESDWWRDTDVSGLVESGFKQLGIGALQGIGSAGAQWVLAKFLDAVGLGRFAEFITPMAAVVDKLNAIAKQVTVVEGQVEVGIQATEQSQYDQLVSDGAPIAGDIRDAWDRMSYEATMTPSDPTLPKYNADLLDQIDKHLRTAPARLNDLLAPSAPGAYGILQAASAYLGSRVPFYTQRSSNTMQAVFDYYQLMQFRLSILLANYYNAHSDTFSPKTIKDTVVDKLQGNVADQRKLLKPALPPGTFIDIRPDRPAGPVLWHSPTWVNGKTLEHWCVDGRGVRHRFYVDSAVLTCDPAGHDSARLGAKLATDQQFKELLDGWKGSDDIKTPLAWLQKQTGLTMTAAPAGTADGHVGFYWVGRASSVPVRSGPVEGPYCAGLCFNDNTLGMYEYLHRYDMQDSSRPSPDAWSTSLGDLDPWNYDANAVLAPTPVTAGEYFWPVAGG